ncbi:MAG: hypothetical protein WC438_05750 [Candidatus Pacearchaeota archaeon]|jgi:hypothetical protein
MKTKLINKLYNIENTMSGKEIAEAVNKIIQSLNPRDFNELINWKDLRVLCVEKSIGLYPEEDEGYIVVALYEAEPHPVKLVQKIRKEFKKNYGFDILIYNMDLMKS